MDHDDERAPPGLDDLLPTFATAVAEGVLVERYQIPVELAGALLEARAAEAGLSPAEVAYRLCSTGALPEGPDDIADGGIMPGADA